MNNRELLEKSLIQFEEEITAAVVKFQNEAGYGGDVDIKVRPVTVDSNISGRSKVIGHRAEVSFNLKYDIAFNIVKHD